MQALNDSQNRLLCDFLLLCFFCSFWFVIIVKTVKQSLKDRFYEVKCIFNQLHPRVITLRALLTLSKAVVCWAVSLGRSGCVGVKPRLEATFRPWDWTLWLGGWVSTSGFIGCCWKFCSICCSWESQWWSRKDRSLGQDWTEMQGERLCTSHHTSTHLLTLCGLKELGHSS